MIIIDFCNVIDKNIEITIKNVIEDIKVIKILPDKTHIVHKRRIKMSDSISSIGSSKSTSAASSTSSSTAAQKLTDETKKKLQDLGVDTTSITTEAQGQIALLQALQQAQTAEKHPPEGIGGNGEMESIKAQASALAAQVGATVSSNDKLPDIMDKISTAINSLQSQAGTDEAKLSQVQSYQSQYDAISGTLSQMQAQHAQKEAQMSGSMEGLASQNKLYHKI